MVLLDLLEEQEIQNALVHVYKILLIFLSWVATSRFFTNTEGVSGDIY